MWAHRAHTRHSPLFRSVNQPKSHSIHSMWQIARRLIPSQLLLERPFAHCVAHTTFAAKMLGFQYPHYSTSSLWIIIIINLRSSICIVMVSGECTVVCVWGLCDRILYLRQINMCQLTYSISSEITWVVIVIIGEWFFSFFFGFRELRLLRIAKAKNILKLDNSV